jgi:Mrp family chromosome partitioning ATPase
LQSAPHQPAFSAPVTEPALGPYLRAIRAHRLVVLLITLGVVLTAIAWLVAVRTPTYQASAQLLVSPLPADDQAFVGLPVLRDYGDPTRTVQTAANLITSPPAAQSTAEVLGDGWTRTRVLDSIDVEPQGESNILSVTGHAPSGPAAARLANTYARQVLDVRQAELRRQTEPMLSELTARLEAIGDSDPVARQELQAQLASVENVRNGSDPTLSLSQTAEVPTAPSGASPAIILALALLAGLALGAGTAVLMELLDRRVRDEDEALAIFPLPVLARIPVLRRTLQRARAGEPWVLPPAVREACRTLLLQLNPGRPGAGQAVMVTSASTGDGKTSSAINIAASLAASGSRVILLDLDLRKPDVARRLSVHQPAALPDLLRGGAHLNDLLQTPASLPTVSVLATSFREGDGVLLEPLYRRLPEVVEEARTLADYVVIDTPPLGEISDALRLLPSVDDVVLVVRPGNTDRVGLATTADLLARSQASPTGFLVIGGTQVAQSSYYGYGAAGRELFLTPPPAPASEPSRPASESHTR